MSSMDLPTFLGAVQRRLPLVALVSEQTTLRRVGRSYRGACPIHRGRNLNLDVNGTRGLYHCFKCGAGGDIINWLLDNRTTYGVADFGEAIRWLADRTGLELPGVRGFDAAARAAAVRERDELRACLTWALDYFTFALAAPALADEVAAARHLTGLTPAAESQLQLGFARSGHPLSANVRAQRPAAWWVARDPYATWQRLKQLGLVTYQGEACTPEAAESLRDVLPPGFVLPLVTGDGRVAALGAVGPNGELAAHTERVAGMDPRRTIVGLRAAPADVVDPDTGEVTFEAASVPSGPAYVWPSLGTFWRQAVVCPGPSLVPVQPLLGEQAERAVEALRYAARGAVVGVRAPGTPCTAWCDPALVEWLDGIAPPESPDQVEAPVEVAHREGHTPNLPTLLDALGDPALRLAHVGWARTQGVPMLPMGEVAA